jgi:NADPH:quinone reductase-like Zn-dependent oxidoreductase
VLVGGSFYNMLKLKIAGQWYGRDQQTFQSLTQEVSVNDNIATVFALIQSGAVKPVIQSVVTLQQVPQAIESIEERTVVGKIVVDNQRWR